MSRAVSAAGGVRWRPAPSHPAGDRPWSPTVMSHEPQQPPQPQQQPRPPSLGVPAQVWQVEAAAASMEQIMSSLGLEEPRPPPTTALQPSPTASQPPPQPAAATATAAATVVTAAATVAEAPASELDAAAARMQAVQRGRAARRRAAAPPEEQQQQQQQQPPPLLEPAESIGPGPLQASAPPSSEAAAHEAALAAAAEHPAFAFDEDRLPANAFDEDDLDREPVDPAFALDDLTGSEIRPESPDSEYAPPRSAYSALMASTGSEGSSLYRPLPGEPPSVTEQRIAKMKHRVFLRKKVKRVLWEAVRLYRQEVYRAGMFGRDVVNIASLATVAVDVYKTSEALKKSEFFAVLDARQLAMLASAGKRRRHARYAALYREGADAKAFYVLTGGKLDERQLAGTLGDDVGLPPPPGPRILQPRSRGRERRTIACDRKAGCEYVLCGVEGLLDRPRASTMTCIDDVEVLTFNCNELHLHLRPDGVAKVKRKLFEATVESELVHTALFKGLPHRVLKEVATLMELEEVEAGSHIFELGGPSSSVYLVMSGAVELLKGRQLLNTLSVPPGGAAAMANGLPAFGEAAMLDRRPRTANARAVVDTKLLVIPVENFATLTIAVPDFKTRLRRLRSEKKVGGADGASAPAAAS